MARPAVAQAGESRGSINAGLFRLQSHQDSPDAADDPAMVAPQAPGAEE